MFHDRRATHWHWNFISLGRRAVCRVHVNLFINHLTLKAFLAPLHTRWAFRSVDFSINKHFFLFWAAEEVCKISEFIISTTLKMKKEDSPFLLHAFVSYVKSLQVQRILLFTHSRSLCEEETFDIWRNMLTCVLDKKWRHSDSYAKIFEKTWQ